MTPRTAADFADEAYHGFLDYDHDLLDLINTTWLQSTGQLP